MEYKQYFNKFQKADTITKLVYVGVGIILVIILKVVLQVMIPLLILFGLFLIIQKYVSDKNKKESKEKNA